MLGRVVNGSGRAWRARVAYMPLLHRSAAAEGLGIGVEVLVEDLQRGRGGRIDTEPAFLDRHRDDDTRVRIGREDDVPGLVEVAGALRRTGLAGDRDREPAEDRVRGPAGCLCSQLQPLEDRRTVAGVDRYVARRRR